MANLLPSESSVVGMIDGALLQSGSQITLQRSPKGLVPRVELLGSGRTFRSGVFSGPWGYALEGDCETSVSSSSSASCKR